MIHPAHSGRAALLAFFLVIFSPLALAKTEKPIKMTFEVRDGTLELKTGWLSGTTNSNCARSNHDGCYEIPVNYYGDFELTLKKGDNECSDPDRWKFHSIILGGESDVTDPSDKPREGSWGNISAQAAQDFNADRATGEVNFTVSHSRKVKFRAENDHALSIWYKVAVASCRTDEDGNPAQVLEYDPRVDNRGQPSN